MILFVKVVQMNAFYMAYKKGKDYYIVHYIIGTRENNITEVKNQCQGDNEDNRKVVYTRVS